MSTLSICDCYHRLIDLGQAADRRALVLLKNRHQAGVPLRDLAYAVQHAAKALSKATLEAIARS